MRDIEMENTDTLEAKIQDEINTIREKYGEVNLFVSGGIDSGLLAALSKPDRLFTVRIPFDSRFDEFEDVLKTVRHLGLEDRLTIVDLDLSRFDEVMKKAVKAIGRPIPHFNIFPFYIACETASKMGIKHIVTGDGPDESMCGYTRHIIMKYLYEAYEIEAFDKYEPTLDKILGEPDEVYAKIIGMDKDKVSDIMAPYELLDGMCAVDTKLMRPDMDDMTDGIAKAFGITIHRPYQDNPMMDRAMFNLFEEQKIVGEFGKFLLRKIAAKYLPLDIAWRKQKIGGPLVPVNQIKGWNLEPFDKSMYLKWQKEILNG